MKHTLTLILTLFLSTFAYSQGRLIEKYPFIQREVKAIDQLDSTRVLVLENEEFMEQMGDGGGELRGIYDEDGTFRKIRVTYFQSSGKQTYTFYLLNERPIYVDDLFNLFKWDEETGGFDLSTYEGGFHGEYLFRDGQLIDQLSLGHNRFENEDNDAEVLFLKECGEYLNRLKAYSNNQ